MDRSPRFRPAVLPLEDRLTPALNFATQQIFTVGNGPFGVTTGDLNGDGRADIVTTDDVDGAVSIMLNTTPSGTATPTFAAKQDFTVVSGTGPVAVLVADLNGDGRPDIATANNSGSVVAVLLNTTQAGAAALTFASVQTFAVGAFPVDIKAGDFNGDGRSDLVVSNNGAGAGAGTTISVLLNTTPMQSAAASFAPQQTFPVGTGPRGVAVGDLNGDGRADIAVANSGNGNISVLLNTTAIGAAAASFAPQTAFATGTGMGDVEFGDLNGDGRLDLAVPNNDASSVSVLLNTMTAGATTPTFAARQDFPVGTNPFALKVGDFDGDGRNDIATANSGTAVYRLADAGWTVLPGLAAAADKLAVAANGDVVANVPAGVYCYRATTGWVQLNGISAAALAIDANGDVAASFAGFGTYRYKATTGWQLINGVAATSLAMGANGAVAASFGTFGVAKYIPSAGGWQSLHTGTQAPTLAMDLYGNVFATLSGFGVYEFNPFAGWVLRRNVDAGTLRVG